MSAFIPYYVDETNFVSPPGDTLLELLGEQGMSQAELAQRMGRPTKTINEIIKGKTAITAETALQLEKVFSVPARFWLAREQDYREFLARQAENEELQAYQGWLNHFPTKKMQELGWLPSLPNPQELLVALLQFFGLSHPDSWEDVWKNCLVSYRKTAAYQSSDYALAAWLRQGEIEAQAIRCAPYDKKGFEKRLYEIRALTYETNLDAIRSQLAEICATVGVAVVVVPQVDGARVSGAARWLDKERALIQLSLRYKTDDQFWFSFFHEAGHILLHSKRELFLDMADEGDSTAENEAEANRFAANMLIPAAEYEPFVNGFGGRHFSQKAVEEFAQRVGIAPGVAVGRLQHDEHLPRTNLNGLKKKLAWGD